MAKKLRKVLLVDDDDDANFIQERLIRKSDFAENIDKACNGFEALEYLNKCIATRQPLPEIIFLDLNMPKMNGWDFIERYNQFSETVRSKMSLIILTSSINPDDAERASKITEVIGFKNKFLNGTQLDEILKVMPS